MSVGYFISLHHVLTQQNIYEIGLTYKVEMKPDRHNQTWVQKQT